eukprot:Skav217742  [mRNA]  locus=scaffold2847:259105:264180:+ [translate_table: standard]
MGCGSSAAQAPSSDRTENVPSDVGDRPPSDSKEPADSLSKVVPSDNATAQSSADQPADENEGKTDAAKPEAPRMSHAWGLSPEIRGCSERVP